MRIKGYELDVDIRGELEEFEDRFNIIKERGNKFIACSPFREERHPSFAVNLETGVYIDSGCLDAKWKAGNFIKLLSYLREETYEDTEEYLWNKYRLILDDVDQLELKVDLEPNISQKVYPVEKLQEFAYKVNYLDKRNISEQVQRAFKTGYDPKSKAIVLPIMDRHGQIVNFKYRRTDNKIFWYDKEGQPVKQHLYGLHFVHQMKCKRVYIVEGEIDCLYLWSHRIPAIATFGASLSKRQEQLILNSPIETLVIATDMDAVGQSFAKQLEDRFTSLLDVEQLLLPEGFKDVNEIPPESAELLKQTISLIPSFL